MGKRERDESRREAAKKLAADLRLDLTLWLPVVAVDGSYTKVMDESITPTTHHLSLKGVCDVEGKEVSFRCHLTANIPENQARIRFECSDRDLRSLFAKKLRNWGAGCHGIHNDLLFGHVSVAYQLV